MLADGLGTKGRSRSVQVCTQANATHAGRSLLLYGRKHGGAPAVARGGGAVDVARARERRRLGPRGIARLPTAVREGRSRAGRAVHPRADLVYPGRVRAMPTRVPALDRPTVCALKLPSHVPRGGIDRYRARIVSLGSVRLATQLAPRGCNRFDRSFGSWRRGPGPNPARPEAERIPTFADAVRAVEHES